jgi:RNA polymerase sigma-70 factor (ECF subfamily)
VPHTAVRAAELVRAAQAGDRAAFGTLYERFSGYVFAILLARLPHQDASDLVQDVFVIALERLSSLREPEAFPGWIGAIARRRAVDAFRVRPGDRMTSTLRDYESRDASPLVRAEASQVLETIQALPEAYRETLVLRLVQGLTGPEIADVTGLTADSVRVNLHRGFRLLRDAMGARA